jgi:hypothetical protein
MGNFRLSFKRKNVSLASLSLNATENMMQDPLFTIYRHAFETNGSAYGDEQGSFRGQPSGAYGDTIVIDLFDRKVQYLQTEAVLVVNVWMAVVHELYEVLRTCRLHHNVNASMIALDGVAALWIGADQGFGSSKLGHLLYRLTEIAGERFGQDNEETWVNTGIVKMLNSIQIHLSVGLNCSPEAESTILRDDIYRLVDLMTIPLIQNLIHHVLTEEGNEFVDLYLSAVMPRVSACDVNLANEIYLDSTGLLTEDQKETWVESLQKAYSCFRLTCEDIGTYVSNETFPVCSQGQQPTVLAGYVTSSPDARILSYIDRDLVQLEIFLQSEANEAAFDLYRYGYNAPHSLQDLALNIVIPKPLHSLFDLYQGYYQSESNTFIDDEIQMVLRSEGDFKNASKAQTAEIIVGLVQYEITYLSVASSLQAAVEECWASMDDPATKYWDMGAAFFIGSIEGNRRAGKHGGRLLYGSSKRLCHTFKTCEKNGENSQANNMIIDALSHGKEYILNEECHSAGVVLQEQIIPALQVPLIQGALAYGAAADGLSSGSGDRSLGTAHAFSRGILPLVHQARQESALVIDRNLRYSYNATPVVDGLLEVAQAFHLALPAMDAKCEYIGTLKSAFLEDLCQSQANSSTSPAEIALSQVNSTAPPAEIAFGRYNFSSPETADQFASIALDVRDMNQATSVNDTKNIYENGLNAFRSSNDREYIAITLASFSTEAANFMCEDPMFNFFKYALYDDSSFDDENEATFTYANEIVQEALLNAENKELAAESSVILNVWMMIAHQLYNVVRTCEGRGNAKLHVDSAVALWIGKDQSEGKFSGGWLLYSVAQTASMQFGHNETESAVNSQLMKQFNELQSAADTCIEDPEVHLDIRIRVNDILRLLSIPLLQRLLTGISSGNSWQVELYAAAVIPQSVGCSPEVHSELGAVLYAGFSKDKMNDEVVRNLAVFMRCMRISCQDLEYSEQANSELKLLVSGICENLDVKSNETNLIGYSPNIDVQETARIDLDILQIGIFMRTRAYVAALDLYQSGQNSFERAVTKEGSSGKLVMSLQRLATLPEQTGVGHLSLFSEFYGTSSYADEIIMHCLDRTGLFRSGSRLQLADSVASTLQAMVSYIAVTWNLEQSLQTCKERKRSGAIDYWSTGIAFFVGSIDSSAPDGGYLLHSLGVEQCSRFNTCDGNGDSVANTALFELLEKGKEFLGKAQCSQAQELLHSEILPLLQVPLVQSTLYNSILDDTSEDDASGKQSAIGHIFAQSILPVVDEANTQSGLTIAEVFHSPLEPITTPYDAEAVFDAFKYALPKMNIDCHLLGQAVDRPDLSLCFEFDLPASVENHANIALDVAEMSKALMDGQNDLAQNIYIYGKNSHQSVEVNREQSLRSLQSFSTEKTSGMLEEPIFNLFLNSYSSGRDGPKFQESLSYADRFVQEALMTSSDSPDTIAAEAAVALNVWMYLSHMLHNALAYCSDNVTEGGNITHVIDEAAAYWIGDAKVGMDGQRGHLLYALADEMDGHFESSEENVLSVNQHILTLFAEAKHQLFEKDACSVDSDTLSELHSTVNEIHSQMMIPLVQGLIHSLKTDDRDRVRLYAYSLVPLIAVCNPAEYEYWQAVLLKAKYNVADSATIVDRIYGVLPCLGLRCSQVGVHFSEMVDKEMRSQCAESSKSTSYAGYRPADEFLEVRSSSLQP